MGTIKKGISNIQLELTQHKVEQYIKNQNTEI